VTTVYPKRPAYFAHRFCRILTKSCAAQDIGQDGAILVMTVALTEDSKRYTGAVTFWNEQLLPIAGFRNWDHLARARNRAVEAGWLHFEPGGRSRPGRYWVTIPDALQSLDDNPVDENDSDIVSTGADYSLIKSGSRQEVIRTSADNVRTGRGLGADQALTGRGQSAEPSNLYPIPIPSPSPLERATTTTTTEKQSDTEVQNIFTVPRESKNDTHRIVVGTDPGYTTEERLVAVPMAVDDLHGLGVWIRWRVGDRQRTIEHELTLRHLLTTYGPRVVQEAAQRLQMRGSDTRKPGEKCWPDELLPEIIDHLEVAKPEPEEIQDTPPIVDEALRLLDELGLDRCREIMQWTADRCRNAEVMRVALRRESLAQWLVDHAAPVVVGSDAES
jgi:hypothetical protein